MIEEQAVAQKVRRTAAEIRQIVSEFEGSGMSRNRFCRVRGLTFGVLNRYLKRMQAAVDGSASGNRLVAVEWGGKEPSAERSSSCGLSVVLRSGREITVNTGFDAATLQRLVEVLVTMERVWFRSSNADLFSSGRDRREKGIRGLVRSGARSVAMRASQWPCIFVL
jgi:hypothetical protein